MTHIEPCRIDDVPEVANLHREVFHRVDTPASEELRAYYRRVFFENPWRSDDFPSLVGRGAKGNVLGFLGVIPRPMFFKNRPIWAAVSHRLMVTEHGEAAFMAARLVRHFLAGKQDFSISDGVTDDGKRIMEAAGATMVLPYSMNWIRPIRPCSYALNLAISKRLLPSGAAMASPACRLADRIFQRISKDTYSWNHSENLAAAVDETMLMEAINRFSAPKALRPQYEPSSLRWIWDRLSENVNRGKFMGFALKSPKDELLGSCLYYLNRQGVVEVVQIAAMPSSVEDILKHLFLRTMKEGATCVFGRLEPAFTPAFWNVQCVMKQGAWTLVHSNDREIINLFLRNDIFLTGLEAELWLSSPKDMM